MSQEYVPGKWRDGTSARPILSLAHIPLSSPSCTASLLSPAFQQLVLFGVGILLTTYTAPNTKGPWMWMGFLEIFIL